MNLTDMTVKAFARELAGKRPAPGGGSVAALAGSLAAALGAMVARLTVGKTRYREVFPIMETIRDHCDALQGELLELVDRDADAYNGVAAAYHLPRETEQEKARRRAAIQKATREAAEIPLRTLQAIAQLPPLLREAVAHGNPNCITDAGVAVQMMRSGALGAAYNVKINLAGLGDAGLVEQLEQRVSALLDPLLREAIDLSADIEARLAH